MGLVPLKISPSTKLGWLRAAIVFTVALVALSLLPVGPHRNVAGAWRALQPSGQSGSSPSGFVALAVVESPTTAMWWLTDGRAGLVGKSSQSAPGGATLAALHVAEAAAYGLARVEDPDRFPAAQVMPEAAVVGSPAERYGVEVPAFASPGLVAGLSARLENPPVTFAELPVDGLTGGSLGLAVALTQFDVLLPGDLSGSMTVAATGSIDAGGNVLPVRSIAWKALAARDVGADVLFVPAPAPDWMTDVIAEERNAAAVARGVLDEPGDPVVVEVASLAEAVRWLCDNGGAGGCTAAELSLVSPAEADSIATGL